MTTRHHHSETTVAKYRTVTCKADGRYVVIAAWSTFEKALGCSYGFYAAEKVRYEALNTDADALYSAEYFSVFVQRRNASDSNNAWTTVAPTLLRLDFDSGVKANQARRSFKSGEFCTAVLLDRKSRKGGWVAAIPNTTLAGPITNTEDVPAGLQPGATVKLKIGAIDKDGSRSQFTWMAEQKATQ
jgi:hypothetical protein